MCVMALGPPAGRAALKRGETRDDSVRVGAKRLGALERSARGP